MNLLFLALLTFSSLTFASSWPGIDGKICLDTPKPGKASGQDYKMAYDGGLPTNRPREERIEALNNRPTLFAGELMARVNGNDWIDLPKEKGVLIAGLDPKKKHRLQIKTKNGRIQQSFHFEFANPEDPRTRITQGKFYHINMQVNPPPKKCPWPLVSEGK